MKEKLRKITDYVWELPLLVKSGMKVPVKLIASEKLIQEMEEVVFAQASNVASLPGLVREVIVLPDAHSGYGAPIGCVFAADPQKGIISPGACGYDINCGMRLIATNLTLTEVKPKIRELIELLFDYAPPGVGREGVLKITYHELEEIAKEGAAWMVKKGFGWEEDLQHIEEKGKIDAANPDKVSKKAKERGKNQLGTLGSGNHYLEIQRVEKIFDPKKAQNLGFFTVGQVAVMLHCGSRGFGHQVAADYLRIFEKKMEKYDLQVADLQLACVPFSSSDGQDYYQAMSASANFAFANREIITYQIRKAFQKIFSKKAEDLGMKLVYDVAHNIAKIEEQKQEKDLAPKKLLIHRKGATRSFPHQPVIIGGSMETGSYLLLGTEKALSISFGSTAHGSGRIMSRNQAKKKVRGEEIAKKMEREGIAVKAASWQGLAEEAGLAYKDINKVIESVTSAGISLPVISFKPLGNIKG